MSSTMQMPSAFNAHPAPDGAAHPPAQAAHPAAPPAAPAAAPGTFPMHRLSELPPAEATAVVVDHACKLGASDLFFSTQASTVEILVRHLDVVKPVASLPLEQGLRCIAHLRADAGMKFAERRHPIDGRMVFRTLSGLALDLRLSVIPTLYGSSLAIRLLSRESGLTRLDGLGFTPQQLGSVYSLLANPSGLILVTGPTGAGKTTSLYACLHHLNTGKRRIHTIEDPVEYAIPGLEQTQVEVSGADFYELLRGVLRQSPDIIMIGEIRDRPTAETAVRAANSGQLVLASLHAPVAAAALRSMLGLGVSPQFLSSCLLGVIGQRLIRTLNPKMAIPVDLRQAPRTFEEVGEFLAPGEGQIVYAAAPDGSGNEGYSGRTGIFEVMTLSSSLRRLLTESQATGVIAQKAIEEGMLDLRRTGLVKVAQGITSFDEIYRVIPSGDLWVEEAVSN